MVNKKHTNRDIDAVKENAVWIKAIEKEKLTADAWEDTWGFYKHVYYIT